ncbi:acyltransferase [Hymenobacter sp. BT559]|uniref:acyltransferase family protein n=1 Tax=Hymenobacter sp. BT559 TaxID=2795729 RepID=UPI0018EB2317|nr:acyltransferase [Hymenobacter sp. BT559]MBJ6144519.1 acyltransferase [Hymenobacter sp. BT559]
MPTLNALANRALGSPHHRIFGLDLLRAVAIFITVYGHAVMLVPPAYRSWHNLPVSAIDGVNIFFVLSGYLIGGILLKALLDTRKPFALGHFWMRRWLRTLPAYLVVLGSAVALGAWQGKLPAEVWRYFCFSQNLMTPHPAFFPEGWSLAVEEWFYLLFPMVVLVLAGLTRSRRAAMAGTVALFLVLPLVFKYYQYQQGKGLDAALWDGYYRRVVAARLDAIALGVLACYLQHYHTGLWHRLRRPGLGLAAALLVVTFLYPKLGPNVLFYNVWLRPLLEGATVLLVLPFFSQLRRQHYTPSMRGLTLLSLISYSMYLLNKSVLIKLVLEPLEKSVFTPYLGSGGWLVAYALYWVLLLIGALLLYTYVEVPFMKLREVFEKPKAAASAPELAATQQ